MENVFGKSSFLFSVLMGFAVLAWSEPAFSSSACANELKAARDAQAQISKLNERILALQAEIKQKDQTIRNKEQQLTDYINHTSRRR